MIGVLLLTALAAGQATFPTVEATRLDGTTVMLPAGLGAEHSVVLVGFARDHQDAIDTWVPAARRLAETDGVDWVQTPVMGEVGSWFQPVLRAAIRGAHDATVEPHVLLLFADRDPLVEALGVEDEAEILVALVHRDGTIDWTGRGSWSAESEAALAGVLGADD